MRLSKFFLTMGFVTALALTYIHMQMQIIDLAYQSNRREAHMKKLIEANGNANYKILMLKSANHLGTAMLDEGAGFHFADTDSIVRVTTAEPFPFEEQQQPGAAPRLAHRTNSLIGLLSSFGVTAEAKTSE